MIALEWITAGASLTGVWLNIHKRSVCFVIWGFTNATWAAIDAVHGIWSQAALQTIYCGLSVYGVYKWRRDG